MDSKSPNVLFYVSDSLRADHVSSLGYHRETTPHFDAVADDGFLFEQMFSQAIMTVPSSVSILTGLYPETHGALATYDGIPSGAPRIARRLQENGYATAAFSSIVQVAERRNFAPGFDKFEEIFKEHEVYEEDAAKLCTDYTIDWIESVDDPFFAFVWSVGPHEPYWPRAGVFADDDPEQDIDGSVDSLAEASFEDRQRVIDLYDDIIHHSDEEFGRLVQYLKDTGQYEDTIIVHVADHGELLYEHGRMEHAYEPVQRLAKRTFSEFCENYRLFDRYGRVGHLTVLPFDELIHVPGVIKPARETDLTGSSSELVETIDLMPTIADLVGVNFETQGNSIQDVMQGTGSGKETVFADTAMSYGIGRMKAVRSEDFKLVRSEIEWGSLRDWNDLALPKTVFSLLRQGVTSTEVLLDVTVDELSNIVGEQGEIAADLRAGLEEWESANRTESHQYLTPDAVIDDDVTRQLAHLGYK